MLALCLSLVCLLILPHLPYHPFQVAPAVLRAHHTDTGNWYRQYIVSLLHPGTKNEDSSTPKPNVEVTDSSIGDLRHRFLSHDSILHEETATEFMGKTELGYEQWNQQSFCHCSEPLRCTPHHHVAFVKVHKAASSTVANILQRFGYKRGLNFALPDKRLHSSASNYLSKPGDILTRHSLLPVPKGAHYDILWNHAVYNLSAFRDIMPPDTAYITIVREPFQQFVSAFLYYHPEALPPIQANRSTINETNPVSDFLYNGAKHNLMSYYRNKQAEDLGMTLHHVTNAILRHQYIKQLAADFHLVMITEFFDESLVLLRRLLRWDVQDILYIPMNTNVKSRAFRFSDADRARHRLLAPVDYDLYEFFRNRLVNIVKNQSDDFRMEVQQFKNIVLQVQSFCQSSASRISLPPMNVSSCSNTSIKVTRMDCHLMTMLELDFLEVLWRRAVSLLPWKEQLKRLATAYSRRQHRSRFGHSSGRKH